MATWNLSNTIHHILLCNGSSCNRFGAEDLTQEIRKEIYGRGLDNIIHTTRTRCNGRCHDKCVVINYPLGNWYKDLQPMDVPLFIESLLDHKDYTGKISHSYNGQGFDRSPEVVTGIPKDRDKVKKVSKLL